MAFPRFCLYKKIEYQIKGFPPQPITISSAPTGIPLVFVNISATASRRKNTAGRGITMFPGIYRCFGCLADMFGGSVSAAQCKNCKFSWPSFHFVDFLQNNKCICVSKELILCDKSFMIISLMLKKTTSATLPDSFKKFKQ